MDWHISPATLFHCTAQCQMVHLLDKYIYVFGCWLLHVMSPKFNDDIFNKTEHRGGRVGITPTILTNIRVGRFQGAATGTWLFSELRIALLHCATEYYSLQCNGGFGVWLTARTSNNYFLTAPFMIVMRIRQRKSSSFTPQSPSPWSSNSVYKSWTLF